ncbi:MAG TPA: hypothetical protein V6C52_12420 [Coleofasciculaceae cyanobacterium]|jgi:hypothetical protein
MRNFISSYHTHCFKVINLDAIAYVDFVSSDDQPNAPMRCTIYCMNGDKSISLENAEDAQGLLEAMRSYAQD